MKKTLKKFGAVVTIAAMMTVSLAGCAKKTTCSNCNQKKSCKKLTVEFAGEKESDWVCKDCYKKNKEVLELSESFGAKVTYK